MKKIIFTYVGLFFVPLLGCSQPPNLPNIIVILADDIGLGDISYYRRQHSERIILETPNIDQLAQTGTYFTNAHSPAALCAPSRYAIMTGTHCYRSPYPWGVWSAFAESPIQANQLTLPKLLKQAGYQTAFFGKWHLGGTYYHAKDSTKWYRRQQSKGPQLDVDIRRIVKGGPNKQGFDYSITLPAGIQNVPYAVYENDVWMPLRPSSEVGFISNEKMEKIGAYIDKEEGLGDSNWDPHLMGPLLAKKATQYINQHAKTKKPFFIYYNTQAVHVPHVPPKKLGNTKISGTTPSRHLDMVKELDAQIGQLQAVLRKNGLLENTLFVFTSDNGGLIHNQQTIASGHRPSDIYRGSKNLPYEGGHRVPFIVSWPKELPQNQPIDDPVLGLDILATLAAVTHQSIPQNQAQDSYNLLPVIQENASVIRPFLMIQGGSRREVIFIEKDWKLIIQVDRKDKTNNTRTPIALFNLKDNPTEKEEQNWINHPDYLQKVRELFKKYNRIRDSGVATNL